MPHDVCECHQNLCLTPLLQFIGIISYHKNHFTMGNRTHINNIQYN